MSDLHFLTMLGLGFVLGFRHALDADHVAAVSTMLARSSSVWRSGLVSLYWGVGHTVVLLAAGTLVMAFQVSIPDPVAQALEGAVGLMLVCLGGSLAWTLYVERWHWHSHEHDGARHLHIHHHQQGADHNHLHWWNGAWKPFVVGMVHGLAGSAALLLLVLSNVRTLGEGLTYIAVFGVGSIFGMMLTGALISLPMVYAGSWGTWGPVAQVAVRGMVSLGAVGIGAVMIVQAGFLSL
jgi:high-affinity nickel permease